jgi:hypothetical protein
LAGKNKIKTVLDMKRSNAIGILLSKMPDIDAIVAAIWGLDDSVLSRDNVDALLLQVPTSEEVAMVQSENHNAGSTLKPILCVCAGMHV